MSANTKFETLCDIARKGGNLRVECSCGRKGVLDAARLSRWYACHGWSTRMHMIREHLKCGGCGQKPSRIRPTGERPTVRDRFPADEAGWARVVKRLRG